MKGPHERPSDARLHRLLRRLRDLNLAAHRVAVRRDATVILDGCLSLDAPVELGVRYRVLDDAGNSSILHLRVSNGELEARVSGAETERRIAAPCIHDEAGRTALPTLGARVEEDSNDPRTYEHFLRRIVRGLYAA